MVDLSGRTLLSKYRIERLLGQGGMGSVWAGVHTLTGRKIAIKILDDRFLANLNVVQRFGREARAASAIHHDGIVEVLDLDQTEEGMPFLVMEFLEGELLSRRINRRGKLPQDEVVRFGVLLLDALHAAHLAGVVHRDLKPDNIFLVPAGRRGEMVKILDFGISSKDDETQAKLTVTGSVLGTPHYMSPEAAMGDAGLDQRVDIYGAAVVLYECAVGDVPFDAANYNKLLRVILDEAPPPPRKRGADISPALEAVILRGMAKKRDDRYTTALQFKTAFEDAAAGRMVVQLANAASGTDDSVVARWEASALAASPVPSQRADTPSEKRPRIGELPAREISSGERSRPAAPIPAGLGAFDEPEGSARSLELDEHALSSVRTSSSQRLQSPYAKRLSPEPGATSSPGMLVPPAAREPITGRHIAVRDSLPPPPAPEPAPAPPAPPPAWHGWAIRGGIALTLFLLVVVGLRWAVRGGDEATEDTRATDVIAPPPETHTGADWVFVEIDGVPPDAHVRLDGLPGATLPLRVRRGTRHTVDLSAPGYVDRRLVIQSADNQHLRADMRPDLGTGQHH